MINDNFDRETEIKKQMKQYEIEKMRLIEEQKKDQNYKLIYCTEHHL